jgi:hypothetical protein
MAHMFLPLLFADKDCSKSYIGKKPPTFYCGWFLLCVDIFLFIHLEVPKPKRADKSALQRLD